nr:CoA ester lyase [uncultured Cupriavidus sp.]
MRSKLFVPGNRPEFFAKALASDADALSFDLEDAVPANRKDAARQALAGLFADPHTAAARKTLIVRVNAVDTAAFAKDVRALAGDGVDIINVPKVESPDETMQAAELVIAASAAHDAARTPRLLLNIESPRGLRRAAEIAQAHPLVMGLQLGFGDLFEPLGIARRDTQAVHACMLALRLAAGEAGVLAVDGAFPDIGDPDGYRAEAEQARQLGFVGKSCIHPKQVALANAVFCPGAAEIERALRVVEAAAHAARAGLGACTVDGQMIDAPFVKRAEALLAQAREHGLLEREALSASLP